MLAAFIRHFYGAQSVIFNNKPRELCVEQYLAAVFYNAFAYALHYIYKYISADMRLCVVKYALGRAVLIKGAQYPAYALIAYARAELPVGKRSRAALSELDVALRVELAARAEGIDLFLSSFGIGAALKKDDGLYVGAGGLTFVVR